jgi:hypothetical protein
MLLKTLMLFIVSELAKLLMPFPGCNKIRKIKQIETIIKQVKKNTYIKKLSLFINTKYLF